MPPLPKADHIALFDGHCNLCNASVDFILRRDRRKRIHFASLQSELGKALLKRSGTSDEGLDTVVYFRNGKVYKRSDASLRIAVDMGGIWSVLGRIGLAIPRPVRNAVYRWIARNRLRWFGHRETCRMPTPEERERLLG